MAVRVCTCAPHERHARVCKREAGLPHAAGPAGTGTASGINPAAFRSAQNAGGMTVLASARQSVHSSGDLAPTTTDVTAGWPSGNSSAAARSATPWASQTASSSRARRTVAGAAAA